MKRDFQIDFLRREGLEPQHHVVDIGCGTLRGGIPLIRYLDVGHYYGIEARPHVLDEAKKELTEQKLSDKSPTLIQASVLDQLSLGRHFEFIWAFSVLIHMDDANLRGCLDFAHRHLTRGGRFFANVNIGRRTSGTWQGFPVLWRTMQAYRDAAAAHDLAVTDLGDLASLGHHSGQEEQDRQRMLSFSHTGGAR
jgi:cyclopropane fatty-acyl-phospholipid synthase-like methyltransferase